MPVVAFEIRTKEQHLPTPEDQQTLALLREAGLAGAESVRTSRRYFLEGGFDVDAARAVATPMLHEAILEDAVALTEGDRNNAIEDSGRYAIEIHLKPGVMDPASASIRDELTAIGLDVANVRTARRFEVGGSFSQDELLHAIRARLANDCIEDVVLGTAGVHPAPQPPNKPFELQQVALRDLDATALQKLSREGSLFLSLAEMQAIQAHFRELDRDPTDLELETLAQTWSEHCVHKTLKSAVDYRGAPFPGRSNSNKAVVEVRYQNLLKDTIAAATQTLIEQTRGPECLSVFVDNAGIIGFDKQFGVAMKVETHNHPSAIEPYGGAATGIGGCIRDVIGCGLGAWPFASTDVFCVAPSDWPEDELPKGVLHPQRVLRGIVQGVADYGNRMGIPTVNGAVDFDVRYLANPLVYCGCVGLIPRDKVKKEPQPGDLIVVLGGRTGRDGIHGATFSSAEMTDTHTDEFSHAVQIGNAIEEKRVLDAVMRARDHADGCLYNAITDCGAGGLSSAIGEMGEHVGAIVELEKVPLKYAGLRYDEIWISEAQERMVLAVPPANIEKFMACVTAEASEATVVGTFGCRDSKNDAAQLHVRFAGETVGTLAMDFLHNGVPGIVREASWVPPASPQIEDLKTNNALSDEQILTELKSHLARADVATKNWIVRKYDHEVQGSSVVKPFMGPGRGPTDAAVVRPVLSSDRGVAIGCGLQRSLADIDPFWMAANAIDEAIRNVVCVGGDPCNTAILDNFCWGGCDAPEPMGALVRACQACHDVAVAYGTPFVSGKDSLNNQFALEAGDVERLIAALEKRAAGDEPAARHLRSLLPTLTATIRETGRLAIPPTLLISALAIVPDVTKACTSDLKQSASDLLLVGGLDPLNFDFAEAAKIHATVADLIATQKVNAAHDASEAGWLPALAEMSLGGCRGLQVELPSDAPRPFALLAATYVLECSPASQVLKELQAKNIKTWHVGTTTDQQQFSVGNASATINEISKAWRGE